MSIAETLRRSIVVGELIADEGLLSLAVEIYIPTAMAIHPVVYFCMPGSGMNKAYYNLNVEGDTSYSFAEYMAERGGITVAIDHLGVGESSRPRDGFALTPDVMVEAGATLVEQIKTALQQGTLSAALAPLPELSCVGVGHSMGGMLTILQQAKLRSYDAVAILGYGMNGRPDALTDDERPYIDDGVGLRANIVRLTQLRGVEPYFKLDTRGRAGGLYGGRPDRRALNALAVVSNDMLAVMSFFAMIPGSARQECAQLDVPVLLAVGDSDITGPAHLIPAGFSGSNDVTLVVLPETGHTHFIFPTCARLYQRIENWARGVASHTLL